MKADPEPKQRVLVVGETFIDFHQDPPRLRPAGVFHVARGLRALGVEFGVAYWRPEYMNRVEEEFGSIGAATFRLGTVVGSPNVIAIRDGLEVGHEGYEDLLRDDRAIVHNVAALGDAVRRFAPTDVLFIPGSVPIDQLRRELHAPDQVRVHVDSQYALDLADHLGEGSVETLFCSTSSPMFLRDCHGEPQRLRSLIADGIARTVVLKENRGGSRGMTRDGQAESGAYPTHARTGIGVGDVFDAAWISEHRAVEMTSRLRFSAYVASLYASARSIEELEKEVELATAARAVVTGMRGQRLPWEDRPSKQIYLAAPDFPEVDTSLLDQLESSLRHHNFRPIRPIQVNGLAPQGAAVEVRWGLFEADRRQLISADLVVAVPLFPDPGTYVEVGFASSRGIPVILLDPPGAVTNLFAQLSCSMVVRSVGEALDGAFRYLSESR